MHLISISPACLGPEGVVTPTLGCAGPEPSVGFWGMLQVMGGLWGLLAPLPCEGGRCPAWGHVSVLLVPSSGFVPSEVPRPRAQCHGHPPRAMATLLGSRSRGGRAQLVPMPLALPPVAFTPSREMPGENSSGQPRGSLVVLSFPITFRLEGRSAPWFQGVWVWKCHF